jgi:hypothetical protein
MLVHGIHNSWHGLHNQIIRDLTFLIGTGIRCDFSRLGQRSKKKKKETKKKTGREMVERSRNSVGSFMKNVYYDSFKWYLFITRWF